MSLLILSLGIFLSILLRSFFIFSGTDTADITKFREMGEAVLQGVNPYLSIPYNIYPPLALYIEATTLNLAIFFNVPFHILTKFLPNIADIVTTFLIYKFLIKLKVKPPFASFWSIIFILNPISIIISSAHGQLDSITSMLVLFAIYFVIFHSSKFYIYLAGIFLGLAIAIKPNPIMLLPFFLMIRNFKLKQKLIFSLISILPVLIMLIPYLLRDNLKILESLIRYSGVYAIGFAAILRGILYQDNANFWLSSSQDLLNASKLSFLAGFIFLIIIFSNGKNLIKACLSIYLFFLTVYFGISAQYISWVLPLAIILRERMIFYFSITGFLALLGFYLFFGPEILLGKFFIIAPYQSKYMSIYFLGNLLFWVTTIWWFTKVIKDQIVSFKILTPLKKNLLIYTFVLFIISLVSLLNLVIKQIIYF